MHDNFISATNLNKGPEIPEMVLLLTSSIKPAIKLPHMANTLNKRKHVTFIKYLSTIYNTHMLHSVIHYYHYNFKNVEMMPA